MLSVDEFVDDSDDESSKQPAKETESNTEITKNAFFVIKLLHPLSISFVPQIEISLHEAHVREAWTERIL